MSKFAKSSYLKMKIKKCKPTFGSWITLPDTAVAEIMSKSGFNWLTIDMEHSPITLEMAQELIRVIELCNVVPLVRVGENNPNLIKRVMDAGSHGVIVPMVNSIDDAQKAVNAAKYPPKGTRGVGLARAQDYGLSFKEYKSWSDKNSIVVAQIEHKDAIDNLEDILTVDGIDASIIGPYDLSASMGYPGEFTRTEVKNAINKYIKTCKKLKKPAGFHVIPPYSIEIKKKLKEGFSFLAFSLDTLFLGEKLKEELKNTGVKQ
jgi:2-dehydro-3-deoxyglucarate aldolase